MGRTREEELEEAEAAGKEQKPEARREKGWVRKEKGTKRKDAVTRSHREFGVRRGAGRRWEPSTKALPERREEPGARRGLAGAGSLAGREHTKGTGRAGEPSRQDGGPGGAGLSAGGSCGRRGGAALARISGYK